MLASIVPKNPPRFFLHNDAGGRRVPWNPGLLRLLRNSETASLAAPPHPRDFSSKLRIKNKPSLIAIRKSQISQYLRRFTPASVKGASSASLKTDEAKGEADYRLRDSSQPRSPAADGVPRTVWLRRLPRRRPRLLGDGIAPLPAKFILNPNRKCHPLRAHFSSKPELSSIIILIPLLAS